MHFVVVKTKILLAGEISLISLTRVKLVHSFERMIGGISIFDENLV